LRDYDELWRWSVDSLEGFWDAVWRFYEVRADAPPRAVLAERAMPGARCFEGAEVSYAEHVLRFAADGRPAIIRVREDELDEEISWRELRGAVGALAQALRGMGVERGDRVVAYLPNIPEAVIAMLAVTRSARYGPRARRTSARPASSTGSPSSRPRY
jgi:acetoacetyl-CoA synthetase